MVAETAGQSGPELRAQIDQTLAGSATGTIQITQVDQSLVGTKMAGVITNHELPETDQTSVELQLSDLTLVENRPNLFLQCFFTL